MKGAGKAVDLAGKEGGHFVVHTSESAGVKTAHSMEYVGHESMKAVDGTVTRVDHGGRTVAVKTADGTEHAFDLGKRATIDSKNGVVAAGKFVGKEGDHVVVYHTEEGGKKVVHLVKHVGESLK